MLGNARLTALPVVLALFLLWRRSGWLVALAIPIAAAVALAPWVIRNKVELGCFAITTDGRSLWKANNLNTYAVLAKERLDRLGARHSPAREVQEPGRHPRQAWQTSQTAGDL